MTDRPEVNTASPGKWSESMIELAKSSEDAPVQSLGDYGEEVAKEVLLAAQEWITRFTVAIGVLDLERSNEELQSLALGSGVVLGLRGDMHVLLTAAHVLNRKGNKPHAARATVLVPSTKPDQPLEELQINLGPRPCTTFGFDNKCEKGPDIAMIQLTSSEWSTLNRAGVVAYNTEKKRRLEVNKAKISAMRPWLLSMVSGVRNRASQILQGDRDVKSIVVQAWNTRVNAIAERDGFDYLELPSETTEYSYPAHWTRRLPGTAAEEIKRLDDNGVTQEAWSGTSGAGVWNLMIATNDDGLPNGEVIGELAGICFYANPDKGCIVAHGTKSMERIASAHAENVSSR